METLRINALLIRQRLTKQLSSFDTFGSLALRYSLLLIGLLALGGLCSDTTPTRAYFAPERGQMKEQSFFAPEVWGQQLSFGYDSADEHSRLLADVSGDGKQDIIGFGHDGVWFATSTGTSFSPAYALPEFGYNQGWRVEKHVRLAGDINGDGLEDVVGFGDAGVYRALSTASGFGPTTFVIAGFGYNQGWRVDRHVRLLADANGDGKKDIVAFGDAGVWLALATASGYFTAPQLVVAEFGYNQGWTPADHPRLIADINGDGRQDIVGFANDGVWIALSTGNGFGPAQNVLGEFGYLAGGWRVDRHPRLLADINGDGKQDIVAFGEAGVWTARSTGGGFAAAQLALAGFGYDQGWRVGKHPRFVADLNGDGYQDIVGFGDESVYRALGGPTGFGSMRGVLRELAAERFPFNLDKVAQLAPRFVGDVNGDGKQDLVAFDATEIKVARSSDLAPPPVPTNVRITDETTSSLTFAWDKGNPYAYLATPPAATINSVVIPQAEITAERGPKPPCSPEKIADLVKKVRAPATAAAPEVRIDCSLTLDPKDVRPITKRLIFEGTDASGVTVDCNGVTIDGGPGTFNHNPNNPDRVMVEIRSSPTTDRLSWLRPRNITLRNNCKIKGSVSVHGMSGVESTEPNYVALTRNNAPRDIVFDHVTIEGVGGSTALLYLFSGVGYFQMLNSEIKGSTNGAAIYLDDTSYYNTFRNNYIHAITSSRELMAIDGSSYNTIINNRFYALGHGGIYLYKNCGEKGSMRRGFPTNNTIINNLFYYDWLYGNPPSIHVASRNGRGTSTYTCPSNFFDEARFNVVMQNQIQPERPSINDSSLLGDMIKVGRPDINTPNYIAYNETVEAKIERGAGCYISDGYPDFLRDGQSTNVFHNANGDPVCRGYRLTCNDGALSRSSDSTCQVSQVGSVDFECQASGNNNGCQKTVSVPAGKKIIGAKAACNLEFGTVSATDLNGVIPNFVKVLRASDNVSEGRCTLGSTRIRSGQDVVSGINGLNSVSFGCRENDSNGGDCHIKGRLYYR